MLLVTELFDDENTPLDALNNKVSFHAKNENEENDCGNNYDLKMEKGN